MRSFRTYVSYLRNNYFKAYYGTVYLLSDFSRFTDGNEWDIKTSLDIHLLSQADDLKEVVEFYHRNGKTFITEESLYNDLEDGGYVCIAEHNGMIIAANCLFRNTVNLHGGSKYTLCEKMNHQISFGKGVLYSCYIIVDDSLRHGGVYQQMLYYLMSKFSHDPSVSTLLTITNTNNKAMMHLCGKFFEFFGLIHVKLVFGRLVSRKVLFLDNRKKCWNSEYPGKS